MVNNVRAYVYLYSRFFSCYQVNHRLGKLYFLGSDAVALDVRLAADRAGVTTIGFLGALLAGHLELGHCRF